MPWCADIALVVLLVFALASYQPGLLHSAWHIKFGFFPMLLCCVVMCCCFVLMCLWPLVVCSSQIWLFCRPIGAALKGGRRKSATRCGGRVLWDAKSYRHTWATKVRKGFKRCFKILPQILLKSSVIVLWCKRGDGGRPWHVPRLLLLCVFAWLTPCFGWHTQIQTHTDKHINPLSFTHRHTNTTHIHSHIETRTHRQEIFN